MGIYVEAYEDWQRGGGTYRLQKVDKQQHPGQKLGWYLINGAGVYLPDFHLPTSEPEIMAAKRANEHTRHLGMRVVKVLAG